MTENACTLTRNSSDLIIFIQFQHRPFILRYSLLNLIDAGLFIYFPRDLGQNIYFKVFDGQDIYFKNCQPPRPSESTVCPLTKKGTTFNHSPIVPTAILNT